MVLYEVLEYLNVFRYGRDDNLIKCRYSGYFRIENGTIINLPADINDGLYIAIRGSDLNDGAYQMPYNALIDEEFCGCVYVIRNNTAFMRIVDEITEWVQKNTPSAYASESFGGYSYTRASTSSGAAASWKQAFAERLKPWKKV